MKAYPLTKLCLNSCYYSFLTLTILGLISQLPWLALHWLAYSSSIALVLLLASPLLTLVAIFFDTRKEGRKHRLSIIFLIGILLSISILTLVFN